MRTKTLILKAKKQTLANLSGNNPSLSIGDGFDFFELRTYNLGEDVRRIDWKRSAKMNEPYVKTYLQETQIKLVLVPILGGSLHFGLKRLKQEILVEVLSLLSFSALKNADLVSFCSWQNETANFTSFTKNPSIINKQIENISNTNLLGFKDDFKDLNNILLNRLKLKSLIIFIGDFYKIPNFSSLAKKHEVLAIVLRDKFEENPSQIGALRVANPTSFIQEDIVFDKTFSNLVQKKMKNHDKELFKTFSKHRIRFIKIYTHENVYARLRTLFNA